MAGVEPWSFTMRELRWMAGGAWQRTAWQMALMANCHRDPKKSRKPFKPSDFDPLAPPPPRLSLADMRREMERQPRKERR